MNKETLKEILKEGFENDGENRWAKFNNNKEFYIEYEEDEFKHIFSYAPLDDSGNQNENDSYYVEKTFDKFNLGWFDELDNEF